MPSQRQSTGPQSQGSYIPQSQGSVSYINPPQRSQRQSLGLSAQNASPTRLGEKVASVALLEAEFFSCELIIGLELFTGSGSYGDKIMSAMKRGMYTAMLFFALSIFAAAGPNLAKLSKAIGGMVFIAILLTSPVTTMLGDMDEFFKSEWVGTGEEGTDNAGQTQQTDPSGAGSSAGINVPASIGSIVQKVEPKSGVGGIVASTAAGSGETVEEGYAAGRIVAAALSGNGTALGHALASAGEKAKSIAQDTLGSFGIHI